MVPSWQHGRSPEKCRIIFLKDEIGWKSFSYAREYKNRFIPIIIITIVIYFSYKDSGRLSKKGNPLKTHTHHNVEGNNHG
jgi:hypothetical protein